MLKANPAMELTLHKAPLKKSDEILFRGPVPDPLKLERRRKVRLNANIAGELLIGNYVLQGDHSVTLLVDYRDEKDTRVGYIPLPQTIIDQILEHPAGTDLDLQLADIELTETVRKQRARRPLLS